MGILQFDKTRRTHPNRRANWPESPDTTKNIFERRKPLRKLTVMIDQELLDETTKADHAATPTKVILLKSLLYHELVECYRFVEDVPPDTAEAVSSPYTGARPAYIGYVVLYTDNFEGYWPVTYTLGEKSITSAGVSGNFYEVARDDIADQTYDGIDAAQKRQSDMLALQVAQQSLEADLYITNRPYLYTKSRLVLGRGVTVCTPDDAITAISLYLRTQGEFIVPTGEKKFTMTLNRGMFYWVGIRELLPEAWRWFSACVYHSSGIKDDRLSYLAGAVMSRMQRALELRDQVHMAIDSETNNDINDDALGALDNLLICLMGAIDASAGVAHYILGFQKNKSRDAAWQNVGWLKQVANACPELAKIVAKDTSSRHTLTILSNLRNSIHGEPIHGITKQDSDKTETIIALPKDKEKVVLKSMNVLGGHASWGVNQLTKNFNEVNPGILVDRIFEEVIILLNDIMRHTPVDRLSHIEKANKSNKPPDDKFGEPFSEWDRTTIRWQLGF